MLSLINEQEVLGKVFKMYGTVEEPLFLAKDVAMWIDYSISNTSKMLDNVDAEEKALVQIVREDGSTHKQWFLTESGLYEVLMQSRKPIAKQFKQKVKAILKHLRLNNVVKNKEFQEGYTFEDLSPQMQFMLNIEVEQKRQASEIDFLNGMFTSINNQFENIKEIVSLNPNSWRKDAKKIITLIAENYGGPSCLDEVEGKIYRLVSKRGGFNINLRLNNKRKRLKDLGMSDTLVTEEDIIAEDKKLIEIYVAIVKELAIKHDVNFAN